MDFKLELSINGTIVADSDGELLGPPQSANTFHAGPSTGSPAVPTWRTIAAADLPAINLSSGVTGTLPIANGGTGQTGATAAFNALSPITTRGDLITRDATNNTRLALGASGRYTRSNGTDVTWSPLLLADFPSIPLDTGLITGTLDIANGGTNATTAGLAFNNLAPSTTRGDLIARGASSHSRIPIGTSGKYLRSDGTDPSWQTIDAGDIGAGTLAVARGGTGLGSYAIGDLIYASGGTTLAKLADVATGNALISGGVTTAPSWGKIVLNTHVQDCSSGNFTPTIVGAGTAGTFTYDATNTKIQYSRIGDQVFFNGRIIVNSTSVAPTGNISINGWPITSGANSNNGNILGGAMITFTGVNLVAGYTNMEGVMTGSSATMFIYETGDNVGRAVVQGGELGGFFDFFIWGRYKA